VSSDSTSDDADEIIESNIPTVPSKSIEFPCGDYGFMVVFTELTSSESSEFLVMIQQMIFGVFSFTNCLEFVPKFSILSLKGLDVCHPRGRLFRRKRCKSP